MRFQSATVASMIRLLRPVAAALLLLCAAATAAAQDSFPGTVPDTFRLRLGGMYAWFNTDVTFQQNLTPGGPIGAGVSMDNLVGGSTGGFTARGSWNPLGRFFVDFGYSGFSRTRTEGIGRDFTFGDATYTIGSSVSASMKSQLPYLDFRYGIVKNETTQFGVSLGAAYPILKAAVSASAGVIGPGGPIVGETVTKTAKESLPVPLLGLEFEQKIGEALSAGLIVNGIFAPVHPYVGSIFDVEAHVDWYATRNIGFGGGFEYTKFNLKREETNSYVNFAYSYYGPRVYVILSF